MIFRRYSWPLMGPILLICLSGVSAKASPTYLTSSQLMSAGVLAPSPLACSQVLGISAFKDAPHLPATGSELIRAGASATHSYSTDRLRRIIDFSTAQFKDARAWSTHFLAMRWSLAESVKERSVYFSVGDLDRDGGLEGTLGLTISVDTSEALPMESSLKIKLPRPRDSNGKTFAGELRSYAIESADPRKIFSALYTNLNAHINILLKDRPALRHEKILWTYGDEKSLRLYGAMGFKVDELITPIDKPIIYEGTNWWVMSITPDDLQHVIRRIPDIEFFSGNRVPLTISTNLGSLTILPEGKLWMFEDDLKRVHEFRNSKEAVTINESLGVQARGSARWWTHSQLAYVKNVDRDVYIPEHNIVVSRGGAIYWNERNQVIKIEKLKMSHRFASGIEAAEGSTVAWDETGSVTEVSRLNLDYHAFGSLIAKAGYGIKQGRNYVEIEHLAKTAPVALGAIAAPGSHIYLGIEGPHVAFRISALARDFIMDGEVFRAGAAVAWNWLGFWDTATDPRDSSHWACTYFRY